MLVAAALAFSPFQGDPLYPQVRVQAGENPVGVLVLDLTGDAVADIVTANGESGDVTVLISRGAGAFAPPVSHTVDEDPRGLAAGDLDHDGLPDLVVVCGSGTLHVLLGGGGPAFGAAASFPLGVLWAPGKVALATSMPTASSTRR